MKLWAQNRIIVLFCVLFSIGSFYSCRRVSDKESRSTMYVAVAASTLDVMKTMAFSFNLETGIEIEIIHASSGKLASQIIQSAPYSLFFSADEYYPDFIVEQGLSASKSVVYAQGFLSVWGRNKEVVNAPISDMLISGKVKKIAIANTSTAPYGKAAYQWIEEKGILEKVKHKLVFGESIAQVNTYLMANTVDIAFTSRSSLQHVDVEIKNHLITLPVDEYAPIKHAMIITNFGHENFPEKSLSFFNFVRSEKGQAILKDYGYDCSIN